MHFGKKPQEQKLRQRVAWNDIGEDTGVLKKTKTKRWLSCQCLSLHSHRFRVPQRPFFPRAEGTLPIGKKTKWDKTDETCWISDLRMSIILNKGVKERVCLS